MEDSLGYLRLMAYEVTAHVIANRDKKKKKMEKTLLLATDRH
jgi:hypothetical protein